MKAYELMALIQSLPQTYEGKKYKVISGSKFTDGNSSANYTECTIRNGIFKTHSSNICLGVFSDTEVEEILQEVTLQEAIQAYNLGKTIICEYPNYNYRSKLCTDIFCKGCAQPDITLYTLETGKWYIKS